jgi:hypothetical protein
MSSIFIVPGLYENVFDDGIYKVDILKLNSTLEIGVKTLYEKHILSSTNQHYNIEYRKSCAKIAEKLKKEYPEYFL